MEGDAFLNLPDEARQILGEFPVAEAALGLDHATGVVCRQRRKVQVVARSLTTAAAGSGDIKRRRERSITDDQLGIEVDLRDFSLFLRRRAVQLLFLLSLLLLLNLLSLLLGLLFLLLLHRLLLSLLLHGLLLLLLLLHGLLLLLLLRLSLGDGLLLVVIVVAAAADQRQPGRADAGLCRCAQQRPTAQPGAT